MKFFPWDAWEGTGGYIFFYFKPSTPTFSNPQPRVEVYTNLRMWNEE